MSDAKQSDATPREASAREQGRGEPRRRGAQRRYVDAHDVRAYIARCKEAADEAELRALRAVSAGWILERREYLDHARAWLEKAHAALADLEASVAFTLDQDQAAQEAEAAALLGDEAGPGATSE